MSVSRQQIEEELLALVPLAITELRRMLVDYKTPPAVRKQLIEMALQYGLGKKKVYPAEYIVFNS